VTDLLEPGSTMKPLTVAAGLEAGVITPTTRFDTSPGWIPNGRYRTSDFKNYGVLDTTGIITKSSNVGVSKIVKLLPDAQFDAFLRRFGFGTSTGSGFPGEAPGTFPPPERWSGTHKQTLSYGYSLSVTPLQIARAYAALGNGGRLVTPTFIKGGHSGESREILAPDIAAQVMRMMQTVTEPGGTATRAAILGYHVAGKTGTARKSSGGGYSRRYIAYFAGLVPVDRPRFSVTVVINDPDTSGGGSTYGGGWISAPLFARVMEGALRLMDVPPDDIQTWLAAQSAEEARRARATGTATASAAPVVAPVLPASRSGATP